TLKSGCRGTGSSVEQTSVSSRSRTSSILSPWLTASPPPGNRHAPLIEPRARKEVHGQARGGGHLFHTSCSGNRPSVTIPFSSVEKARATANWKPGGPPLIDCFPYTLARPFASVSR